MTYIPVTIFADFCFQEVPEYWKGAAPRTKEVGIS